MFRVLFKSAVVALVLTAAAASIAQFGVAAEPRSATGNFTVAVAASSA
jgi:hypothetical protein